ncbi:hypothetical protein GCM10011297_16670 [Bacterioplanes sanyensis]|uniref:DUF1289 domain-containing protein n=1 Tax=Bacterioplanes sanyensis TaxID=1249553 RepID=UPI0019C94FAF|nr:DUF1289 domain-containing protein [Bacterioplanes sanyensis]GGY44385.1 hypothetical protein GCM10011297_16670 [Bacterioplanes sanyensis]
MLDQGELFPIPNPCRGVCQVNNRGYCKGCLRSRQERFHWHEFTPFQQQLIINLCDKRRRKILQAQKAAKEINEEGPSPQPDLFANQPAAHPHTPDNHIDGRATSGEQGQLF